MSIKNLLRKFWSHVEFIFHRLTAFLKAAAPVVIQVLENIKQFDAAGGGDVLDRLLPKGLPQDLYDKLVAIVPDVLIGYSTLANLDQYPDLNSKLNAVLAAFDNVAPEFKKAHWHGLAALIIEKLSDDGELSWSDYLAIIEYIKKYEVPQALPAPVDSVDQIPAATDGN
jgi:hypothetical protein